jgi:pimeloyl-ACP methyl ester carboxylesterase
VPILQAWTAQPAETEPGEGKEKVTAQHVDLATGLTWEGRDGPGPTVVWLHGIGSNAGSFRTVFDHMPARFRLVSWNAPGYGGSRPLDAPWPIAQDYAEALRGFLDALHVERVVLVGHSLGTLIASAFARLWPERVSILVLAASACGYRVPRGSALPEKVAARITDLTTLGPTAFAKARAPRLVFAPDANPGLVHQVETAMAAVDPAGYAQAVHMLATGDLEDTLKAVRVPVGFIIGAQDVVTPRDQTLRAARAVQSATGQTPEIHEIEGAGHAVYLQKPAEFTDALMRLIDAADNTPGTQPRNGGHHV